MGKQIENGQKMFPQNSLTLAEIKAALPKAKTYKLAAGGGLYLAIAPNGGKYWRLKYRFGGKEKTLALGVYPAVTYPDALAAREQAKSLLKKGSDPSQIKREAAKLKQKPASQKTSFRMALTQAGWLTIETETKLLSLSPAQTNALKAFLAVNHGGGTNDANQ